MDKARDRILDLLKTASDHGYRCLLLKENAPESEDAIKKPVCLGLMLTPGGNIMTAEPYGTGVILSARSIRSASAYVSYPEILYDVDIDALKRAENYTVATINRMFSHRGSGLFPTTVTKI